MYDDLEQTLTRELDGVARGLVVPELPALPTTGRRAGWLASAPVLAAAAVAVVVIVLVVAFLTSGGPDRVEPAPSPGPTPTSPAPTSSASPSEATDPATDAISTVMPSDPVLLGRDLFVGGEQVPGEWYFVDGRGTHWIGWRADETWWWGYDAQPQRLEGVMDQPPVISSSGGHLARIVDEGNGTMLVGADTQEGGEGFGGVDIPLVPPDPKPRVMAMTDDGLVVARGPAFQELWRPLVDGEKVDLAESAPGEVVIGSTDAGLIVTKGTYMGADGTQGAPYLARLSPEGLFTRIADVPTHDFLEAGDEWLAYVPAGTVGGEAPAPSELRVQRLDGSGSGVLTAPDGWGFIVTGFWWESQDRLVARVVNEAGDGALVRCRPDPAECVLVDVP
jgi:hypothetical protein